MSRAVGSQSSRLTLRAVSWPWYQLPPRRMGLVASKADEVNSQALPAMSSAPTGLRERGCEPTSSGPKAAALRP